jgi:peptide/nickel transport system permease protein
MSLSTVELASAQSQVEDPAAKGIQGRTPLQLVIARLRTDRVAILSIIMILLIVLMAICAPLIAHITGHGPTEANVDTGTDASGQPLPPGDRKSVV